MGCKNHEWHSYSIMEKPAGQIYGGNKVDFRICNACGVAQEHTEHMIEEGTGIGEIVDKGLGLLEAEIHFGMDDDIITGYLMGWVDIDSDRVNALLLYKANQDKQTTFSRELNDWVGIDRAINLLKKKGLIAEGFINPFPQPVSPDQATKITFNVETL